MKSSSLALVSVLAVSLPTPTAPPPTATVLRGVTVIDVTDGRRLTNQTVVVVGNRIQAVGPANRVQVPTGAQVVDGRGKYVTPGFWDMHAHVDGHADRYLKFIAYGVTGVREMAQRDGSSAAIFRAQQQEILAGTRIGPRAVGPSAMLDFDSRIFIKTPDDARRVLDSLKAAGDAFAKFHDNFLEDRALYFAIAREARRVGLPLVGHVSRSLTNVEVADSGLLNVEHINEHRQCWPGYPGPLGDSAAAEQRCAPTVEAYLRNGTWLTATFSVLSSSAPWAWEDMRRFVQLFHRLGMRKFLAGADWGRWAHSNLRFQIGLSTVEEMIAYGESGLSPLEALQTGTLNPAVFFHATDSMGTVAPGKLADLVLLDGDPLVDLHNLLKVRAVVANGRYFDRAALDALDPERLKRSGQDALRHDPRTQLDSARTRLAKAAANAEKLRARHDSMPLLIRMMLAPVESQPPDYWRQRAMLAESVLESHQEEEWLRAWVTNLERTIARPR